MSTMVRWMAVVMAVVGSLALGGNRATAQDEIPGDVDPITAIVYVVDCPYEEADLSECASVEGVPIDVSADGVAVEGSGAFTAPITEGFSGIVVLLPAIGASVTASAPGVSVTVPTADLVYGGCENGVTCAFIRLVRIVDEPSAATTRVQVVVANCPFADADVSDLCTRVEGATVRVAVDGIEVEDSPLVTALGPVGVQTTGFAVPVGATITVWSEPLDDGYVPAPGYAPLTISPDSFYLGGCGGEASCPYVFLINVPAGALTGGETSEPGVVPSDSDADVPADDAPSGVTGSEAGLVGGEVVTRLPNTGVGPARPDGGLAPLAVAMMLTWPLVAGLAVIAAGRLLRRTSALR